MVLIGLILIGYSIFTKPAREAQMAERRKLDSIARVEQLRAMEEARQQQTLDSTRVEEVASSDSLDQQRLTNELGDFASGATGKEERVVLENDLLKLTFSTLGGRPYTVQLKQYQTYDSLPLILFDGDSTIFALQFFADNRRINTGELYFVPEISRGTSDDNREYQQLSMTLPISESASITYLYRLFDGDYMTDFDIELQGLDAYKTDQMEFDFDFYAPSQEKGYQNEAMYTTLYYRFNEGDVESFKARSKKEIEEITETTRIKWIAFSHQFFSTILVADQYFDGAYMYQQRFSNPGKYVRHYDTSIDMPYDLSLIHI